LGQLGLKEFVGCVQLRIACFLGRNVAEM